MSIKRFSDYESTKSYSDYQTLPRGGYVMQIKDAAVHENSRGQYVVVQCDVAEGEFQGFFSQDYENQQTENKKWHCNYLFSVPLDNGTEEDGWTKRKFKTFVEALEGSNSGYEFDWDEKKFAGLFIGGIFNEREYEKDDGSVGSVINFAKVVPVDKVRSGDYKVPKDKTLKKTSEESPTDGEWVVIPEADAIDLPFK